MREITLTQKQYEKLPYKDSKSTKDDSFGDIMALLRKHGIKQYFIDEATDTISFSLRVKYRDMERNFLVKLEVPHLYYPKPVTKNSKQMKHTYLEKESWRIMWWYLKSKLEAIEYGIGDDLREFMPNIYYGLPNQEVPLINAVLEEAERIDRQLQLEHEPESKRVTIEADYKVMEDANK